MATSIPTIPAPLYGKTALVTGGSRGIGRAIAVHLTRLGVSAVALTYASNKTSADSTLTAIREINPDVKAIAIHADILSPAFAPDLISATLSELDTTTLNILVNNAALADPAANQPISSATHEKFQQLMTGNAWAPTQLTLQALPHLPRGGRVINISSTASRQPNQEIATMYGASKAAFDSFTRSLAFNYSAEKGITINSVCVGPTMTDVMRAIQAAGMTWMEDLKNAATAEKRLAEPEDIACVVGWLASDEARWVNGNHVPANGGSMLELQG
ncbi:uncharacterized protein PV06_07216 [Exophiala oligosperma]|uniref:Uncharacterized protein n=2 Tax=Chaetothyriales TaxID=34395 RepID=A0A0D2AP05_9EURO|nr:uncharacterized protein PV06_07216 [Exophiala oligosperma]KAJ9627407.1 hypothetical protein H2204_009818 [Knufia peltigerae]KIW41681.1 hypothetical protein PV06_07216 [Exophiala oligosperma]